MASSTTVLRQHDRLERSMMVSYEGHEGAAGAASGPHYRPGRRAGQSGRASEAAAYTSFDKLRQAEIENKFNTTRLRAANPAIRTASRCAAPRSLAILTTSAARCWSASRPSLTVISTRVWAMAALQEGRFQGVEATSCFGQGLRLRDGIGRLGRGFDVRQDAACPEWSYIAGSLYSNS